MSSAKRKPGQGTPNQFTARKPTQCVVDGCDKTVYGIYSMCHKHFDAYLDGRLLPRRQTPALPVSGAAPSPAKEERKEPPVPETDAAPTVLCSEPGCTKPAKVGKNNRQYKKCDDHWRAALSSSGRQPAHPEPEAQPDNGPESEDTPAPEGASATASAGLLNLVQPVEAALRTALGGQGDVSVSVTGMRITFSGDITLAPESAHEAD